MRSRVFAAAVVAALIVVPSALAAPPTNDSFAAATALASLPASATVDLTEATVEGGEPSGGCWQPGRSAWYSIQTATDMVVRITSSGPYDRTVNLYRDTGSGIGGLSFSGCAYPWSDIVTTLEGGTTYYVQLGAPPWSSAGTVGLDVSVIDPPPNDDLVDAFTASSLPYSNSVDMLAATLEPGEPTQPTGVSPPFTGTAWYAFTSATNRSLMISTYGCCYGQNAAVYTGDSVGALTEVPVSRPFGGRIVFTAVAGAVYRIQNGLAGSPAWLGITIEQTPPLSVGMWWSPSDPSIYDTTAFQANAYDPAGVGIDSYTWDFGDGTGATGASPTHRYAAEGDYSVSLAVTTPDGRAQTETRTVSVRTRDVAITKLSAPQSARVEQTRTITIGVANRRNAETVTVWLYRARPDGGWDYVGLSNQLVPARTGNRTTSFVFAYTFTPDDGFIGKVTFKAVATLADGRDALPGDNEAIAPPTAVGQ